MANPSTLPVHFASFTAIDGEDGVDLKWTTAQEENNKGFAIERSGSDGQWVQIGYVGSSNIGGNSAVTTLYSFVDRQVAGVERVSYRLRQEDLDGKYEYSSVVYVSLARNGSVPTVYAAGKLVNVVLPGGYGACSIVVFDSQGRTMKKVFAAQGGVTTISGLPGGSVCYVVVRTEGGEVRVRKGVYIL